MKTNEIPLPPTVPALDHPPPIVEPALRDLPPFDGGDVGEVERVEVDRLPDEDRWSTLEQRARDVALSDDRVRAALDAGPHAVIGVSRALNKDRPDKATITVVAHSYAEARTYEVRVRVRGDDVLVKSVHVLDYQPAPSDEEVEAAIRIAREHRLVSGRLERGYEAQTLLVSAVDPGDEHYGERRFSVVFGPPDERLPRVHCVVDLRSTRVLWVSSREEGSR